MEEKPFYAVDEPNKKIVALGNEAIARGALEAGCIIGSGYPGTPSTEILETFTEIAKVNPQLNIKTEWSINEKVGFEVAYAGALCGARAIATMKHVGMNVIFDSLISAAESGTKGGFVVITADDPSMHSSQNEQDNRYFGMQSLLPIFEPSDAQEAKDMIIHAFEFSEQYQTPIIFRTTTRLNHSRGDVTLGPIQTLNRTYQFDEYQREKWMSNPTNAIKNRQSHLDRINQITAAAEKFKFNLIQIKPNVSVGIISSGVPYAHTLDVLSILDLSEKVSLMKLGMTFPLPRNQIQEFLKKHQKIIIIEELEPILEQKIKAIAYEEQIAVEIHGKDIFPQMFEFYPEIIIDRLCTFFDLKNPIPKFEKSEYAEAPPRPPVLCPGCGHRNIYTAIKHVEQKLKIRMIHSSDIGCYTLGFYEPLNGIDTCIAMGASIGMANGITKLDTRPVIALLGDSTFFHSGLPALMNAVKNKNDLIVFIMDNQSTSMTGHQDHPGTGKHIDKTPASRISFEKLIEGIGVPKENIWTTNANNLKDVEASIEKALETRGVRVIIPRTLCALLKIEQSKKEKKPLVKFEVDQNACTGDEICLRTLGCPALKQHGKKVIIDENLCTGCSVCAQICVKHAIKAKAPSKKQ